MKHFKKILAIVLALALALSLAVPAAATAEPKLPIAQLLKMKDAGKNPVTPDTLVYPYSQTFGATAIKGNSVLLQFKLAQNRPSTDLFGLIILRGSVEEMANSGELEVVEERLYKMSDFQNGALGMTWTADSRYRVGEYTLVGMLLDKNEEVYEQDYYFVDLYVVDRNIPATRLGVAYVKDGNYDMLPGEILLNQTCCFEPYLEPYANTTERKITVTSSKPEIASVTMDAGYAYVTAKGIGRTIITFTCGNLKNSFELLCGADAVVGLSYTHNPNLCVGMTDKPTVNFTPNHLPISIDWYSQNPEVVTVKDGVVTAVGPGWGEIIIAGFGYGNNAIQYTVTDHDLPEDAPVSERTATKPAMQVGHCSLCGQDDAVNIIEKAIFTDTDYKAWYSDYVDYVYDNGIMNGSGATTFAPDRTMTRAELVTVLYRIAGSPEVTYDAAFTDVPAGQWYSDAVTWAAQNQIVNGVGNGRFAPTNVITREQVATILYRYTQTLGVEMREGADLSAYPDCGSVSGFAVEGMEWAVAEGLITGVSSGGKTTLAPKNSATRAQFATIISRYQQMFPADSE